MSGRELDRCEWCSTSARFLAFEHDFGVRTMDPALGRYLDDVFGALSTTGHPARWYSLVDRGVHRQDRYALFFDGEEELVSASPSLVVARLFWHVNRRAVESCHDRVLVHAAAAEHEGRALLFPAAMNAGKTTLVAALVQAGLRYLTDEAASVEIATLRVGGLAKPLTIERGSWKVLQELEPGLGPDVQQYVEGRWHVDVSAIRNDALAISANPAYIVVPRYAPGAPTVLTPLSKALALIALCENSFNLGRLGQLGLDALTEVVRRSSCYELIVGDLNAACTRILDVLTDPNDVDPTDDFHTPHGAVSTREVGTLGDHTTHAIDAIDSSYVPVRRASIASVEIDGESVLVDGLTGSVHSLDAAGTLIWACFDGVASVEDLTVDLSEAFVTGQNSVRNDIVAFVKRLHGCGLLATGA